MAGSESLRNTGLLDEARINEKPPTLRRQALRRAYIGNFLDKGLRPRKPLATNADVSQYLLKLSLADLGGAPITGPSPDTDARIARTMAAEVMAAIHRSGGKKAMHWYTQAIDDMIKIAAMMHPEVAYDGAAKALPTAGFKRSEDARTVLFAAMSITSQNIPVRDNMGYALEQYRHFVTHGRFDPRGYGIRGASVKKNLERFNLLLDVCDGNIGAVRDFLETKFTMADLKEAASSVGIVINAREHVDEVVYGSMVFGPKIGNGFFQNLLGNLDTVTIDLWLQRTIGRYTGTLVRNTVDAAQIERLHASLSDVDEEFRTRLDDAGVDWNPATLTERENDDLLANCKEMVLVWERARRERRRNGATNPEMSTLKARMRWPGACESIVDSLSATVDAPSSASERRWIRNIVRMSVDVLRKHGYDLSAAEVQAALWYPEKALYRELTGRNVEYYNNAYDEAITIVAKDLGYGDNDIEAALRAPGTYRGAGPRDPGTPGRGFPRPVQGHGEGPDGQGEGPEIHDETELTALEAEEDVVPAFR